jgi:hypothetical protein
VNLRIYTLLIISEATSRVIGKARTYVRCRTKRFLHKCHFGGFHDHDFDVMGDFDFFTLFRLKREVK